jgi:hypothetical protein
MQAKTFGSSLQNSARGFEPGGVEKEVTGRESVKDNSKTGLPFSSPPCPGQAGEALARVVLSWASLPEHIRAAILTLIDAAKGGQP